MLKLSSKITINEGLTNEIIFDFVNEVSINSSYQNLTDTCKIIIPRKLTFQGKPLAIGSDALFKRGMTIKVELGYDGLLKTQFEGFITRVHTALPIELECEDKMYALKKNILTKRTFESVSLKDLLAYIIPSSITYTTNGFSYENLGKIGIGKGVTSAQVLELIRKNNEVYSYFHGNTLYVGLAYQPEPIQKTHVFGFEKNIIDDKGLEWTTPEDQPIKVRGVSIQSNNDVREYVYPSVDAEGEEQKLSIPNQSQAELERLVIRRYNKLQYEGYRGSFTTFGEPSVKHGDLVEFDSDKLEERKEGKYLVKGVKKTFGQNGYRQDIEIGNKITE